MLALAAFPAIAGEAPVAIRYDVTGSRAAPGGPSVPLRTLHTDGTLVFTKVVHDPDSGAVRKVLVGRVDATAVSALVAEARRSGFFDLAPLQQPPPPRGTDGADAPEPPLDAETEILAVADGDRLHEVRVRPARWPGAPAAFRELRDALLAVKPSPPPR